MHMQTWNAGLYELEMWASGSRWLLTEKIKCAASEGRACSKAGP